MDGENDVYFPMEAEPLQIESVFNLSADVDKVVSQHIQHTIGDRWKTWTVLL